MICTFILKFDKGILSFIIFDRGTAPALNLDLGGYTMECRVLVLGHGTISEDIIRTLKLIVGDFKYFHFINLPENQDMDSYEKQIESVVRQNCESGLLIFTDLLGGSPFTVSTRVMRKYWDKKVELITGMNLPMLIEVASNIEDITSTEKIKKMALDSVNSGIVDFRKRYESKEQAYENCIVEN